VQQKSITIIKEKPKTLAGDSTLRSIIFNKTFVGIVSILVFVSFISGYNYIINRGKTLDKSFASQSSRLATDWPFGSNSIWNVPIGDKAEYVESGISGYKKTDTEEVRIIYSKISDPLIRVDPPSNNGEQLKSDRSNIDPQFSFWPAALHFPVDVIKSNCFVNNDKLVVVSEDSLIYQFYQFCRPNNEAAITFTSAKQQWQSISIYSDSNQGNVNNSVYGANIMSGLSSLGGLIRSNEVNNSIRHALQLSINSDTLSSSKNCITETGDIINGCIWPAQYNGGSTSKYKGLTDNLVLGALLALPNSLNINKLNLKTDIAKNIANALQNYGGYVVGESYNDSFMIGVEAGVTKKLYDNNINMINKNIIDENIKENYFNDIVKIQRELKIISNNYPDSVGGGGMPRVEVALPFRQSIVSYLFINIRKKF
jgi:hypothetical protein